VTDEHTQDLTITIKELGDKIIRSFEPVIRALKEIVSRFVKALKPIVFTLYSWLTQNKRISYLAIYHKDPKIRKKNLTRVRKEILKFCFN